MTKKKLIIGGLIGIGCATVGYILGRHETVSVEFLKKAVKEATDMGADAIITLLECNKEKKWTDVDIDSLGKCFIDDATTTINTKTGQISYAFGDGGLMHSDGF